MASILAIWARSALREVETGRVSAYLDDVARVVNVLLVV